MRWSKITSVRNKGEQKEEMALVQNSPLKSSIQLLYQKSDISHLFSNHLYSQTSSCIALPFFKTFTKQFTTERYNGLITLKKIRYRTQIR